MAAQGRAIVLLLLTIMAAYAEQHYSPTKVGAVPPTLQMKKPKVREVESLVRGHTAVHLGQTPGPGRMLPHLRWPRRGRADGRAGQRTSVLCVASYEARPPPALLRAPAHTPGFPPRSPDLGRAPGLR